jgi:hypothetical protein
VNLTLHVAVGSGDMTFMILGGVENEWEVLVSGSPFAQLQTALDLSKSGQVVASDIAWGLVQHRCV